VREGAKDAKGIFKFCSKNNVVIEELDEKWDSQITALRLLNFAPLREKIRYYVYAKVLLAIFPVLSQSG